MSDILRNNFYWFDLIIGYSAPFIVYILYYTKKVEKPIWHLFWMGAAIGLIWEVPIFVLSAEPAYFPIITYIRPQPINYLFFMVAHTLWDGGLFLIGLWFVYLLCKSPLFKKFQIQELFILLFYGQISALSVELISIMYDGWAYATDYWWNPILFQFKDHYITILIQLIWLIATILYYFIVLKTYSASSTKFKLGPA